jgi:hypothetical protein
VVDPIATSVVKRYITLAAYSSGFSAPTDSSSCPGLCTWIPTIFTSDLNPNHIYISRVCGSHSILDTSSTVRYPAHLGVYRNRRTVSNAPDATNPSECQVGCDRGRSKDWVGCLVLRHEPGSHTAELSKRVRFSQEVDGGHAAGWDVVVCGRPPSRSRGYLYLYGVGGASQKLAVGVDVYDKRTMCA